MRRAAAIVMILVLAVLHAPSSAQALMSSLWPDLFSLGTSEPVVLLMTGVVLLSFRRLSRA
jgi:hypothetical protein